MTPLVCIPQSESPIQEAVHHFDSDDAVLWSDNTVEVRKHKEQHSSCHHAKITIVYHYQVVTKEIPAQQANQHHRKT
eukprot:1321708-Ditylum_brightwellii.AAC.1